MRNSYLRCLASERRSPPGCAGRLAKVAGLVSSSLFRSTRRRQNVCSTLVVRARNELSRETGSRLVAKNLRQRDGPIIGKEILTHRIYLVGWHGHIFRR